MNDSSETNPNGSYLGNYTSRFASRLLKSSEIEDEEIKLITKLGSGTFGTVWKGECFGSTVAIKVPIPEKASALTREEIEYLRNEINIMTTNLHPNLILCLGACTEPSKFKIVLELMDGDLERLLIKSAVGKKMTVWQRMSLAKDAARGMLWLHSMNPAIIHRDLKLENLMYKKIDKSYHVKISDFGLSILKPQRISRLRGERVGTLTTMAPEILKGSNYNEKADVYSFSMLLWQIFTCERLYADLDDLSNEALETGICKNEIRPKIPSDCLPSLKKLMEDCWHDNPEKRPDFEAINASLDAILVELAIKDPHGRSFWSEHFLKEYLVPWDEFSKRFYEYLGTSLPDKSRRRYSEIFARTNYLCLKTILTSAGEDEDACVHIEKFGELLNLFGPLNKRRASSLRTSILDNIRKVVSEKWFHGTVERAEAHRRLEGRDAGTFLVRVTPKEHEAFVLTILKKKGGTPHNLAIHKKDDGRFIVGHDESKTYLSLNAVMREIEKLSQLQLIPCPGWPFSSCFDDDERCEEDSNAELSSTYSRVADLMSSMRSMDTRDRDRGADHGKEREDEAATSSSATTAAGATTISTPRAAEAKGTRETRGNRLSFLSDEDLSTSSTAGATSSAVTTTKASPLAKAIRERDDHQSPQTPLQPQLATETLVTPRRQRLVAEREEDERRTRAERERERERDREEERDLDERLEVLRAKLREREKEREDTNLATDNGRSKEAAASLISGVDEVVRSPRLRTRDRAREREQRERERERERDDDRESKKTEDDRERERDRDRGFIGVGPMRLTRRATDDPSVAIAAAAARSPLPTSNLARERERERERDEQRLQRERDDRAKARERERERAKTVAASDDYHIPTATTVSGGSGDTQLPARPAPRDEERDRELRALDEKIEQLRAKIREREREREREMEDGPRQQQQLAQQHDAAAAANLVSGSPVPTSPISTVIANNKAKEDDGDLVSLATGSSSGSGSGSGIGLMSSISSGGSGDDVGASPDLQDRRKQREEERRKQREKWQKEEEERKRRREQIKRQLSERPGRE